MNTSDEKPPQFSLRSLCITILVVALLCSIYPTYRAWRLAQIPFDRSRVTRITVSGGGLWQDGDRFAEITDAEQVDRVITLMENSSPLGVECGGLEFLKLTFYDQNRQLASVWVGDYAEWGYDGKIRGFSNGLQRTVIDLLDRHPNTPPALSLSTPVAE